jgi:hypothetical protein
MEDEKEQWTINLILPRVNIQRILRNLPASQLTVPKACPMYLCLVHMWTRHNFRGEACLKDKLGTRNVPVWQILRFYHCPALNKEIQGVNS